MTTAVIVIGIDRIGKTTALRTLSDRWGFNVKKLPEPARAEQESLLWAYREMQLWNGPDEDVIFYDRFPLPDEWVYTPDRQMTDKAVRWIDYELKHAPGKKYIFYLEPADIQAYTARVQYLAHDPPLTPQTIQDIVRKYNTFMDFSKLTTVKVPVSEDLARATWKFTDLVGTWASIIAGAGCHSETLHRLVRDA